MSVKEARLLHALGDELNHLELLETYTLGQMPGSAEEGYEHITNVKVTFHAQWATNTKEAIAAMQDEVSSIIQKHLPELIQTAVANQRVRVQEAREALSRATIPAPAPPPEVSKFAEQGSETTNPEHRYDAAAETTASQEADAVNRDLVDALF